MKAWSFIILLQNTFEWSSQRENSLRHNNRTYNFFVSLSNTSMWMDVRAGALLSSPLQKSKYSSCFILGYFRIEHKIPKWQIQILRVSIHTILLLLSRFFLCFLINILSIILTFFKSRKTTKYVCCKKLSGTINDEWTAEGLSVDASLLCIQCT